MSKFRTLAYLLAATLCANSLFAHQGETPRSYSLTDVKARETVSGLTLEAIDAEPLRARSVEKYLARVPGPLRIAEAADLEITPTNAGTWTVLPDGELWRLRIDSPGATDLNFGFGTFALPPGATLHVVSLVREGYYVGPYVADHATAGQLWTPVVPGSAAMIELFVPFGAETPGLMLTRVGRGFMDFFDRSPQAFLKQGSCNIDVVCPEGDNWRAQIRSVGAYTLGGIDQCSGSLVNNTSQDFTPYFLTADHCAISNGNAASVVVYWNFESPNCGDLSGGLRNQSTSGSTLRASDGPNDMSLIELSGQPNASYNVFYSGWDARTNVVPPGTVGIHHPGVDEKAITFDTDPPITVNNCIGTGGGQSNTHWEVVWNQGTTEGGSSGSGLFSSDNQRIIGYLSGGFASCSNLTGPDCYGKFSVGFNRGMQPFLDPGNSGALFVDGADPAGGGNDVPVVNITAPTDGSTFDIGTSVAFAGTANDTEDGNLTANLSWNSSIDGNIGSGGSFNTSSLSLGAHTVTASVTDSGGSTGNDSITITINDPNSNGPQNAAYDNGLGAPACAVVGTGCDSVGLLDGRANLGPEPNQPNTLDSCTDGTAGSYHDDESIDRIVVSTLNASDLTAGATVEVAVTVWAWNTGSDDTLDLYYAADANNPSWTLIGSVSPPAGGEQTLTQQYTLPNGSLQAVRANFRYQGAQSSCSGGTYDDADDLVFAVGGGGGGTPQTVTFTSIGAEDGWVRESGENSNQGGAANATGAGSRPIRPGDHQADRQYKSILSFDTSSIPNGATIQSATLRLRRGTVRGLNPFTNGFGQCRVDVNSGGFSGSTALQAADFQATATATAAAALSAPASNGDWSEGVLNAAGRAAINVTGTTQTRVYFEVDDNDNGAEDLMGYYSGDNANAANHPQLVVTYIE